ncbi:MAG: phosphatidylglycerol lysyltransferase domain-containing protein [Victivallaceae bacterium]
MLKPIELTDAAPFNRYLERMDSVSCEMSFANLFLWSPQSLTHFEARSGRLFARAEAEDEDYWFFPIGEFLPPAELARLGGVIYDVPPEYLELHPEISEYFRIETPSDAADYIYDLRKLAECSGPRLRKKRNLIRQFETAFPDRELRPLEPRDLPELAAFAADSFASERQTSSLAKEVRMWPNVLAHLFASELRLGSLQLRVNGRLAGFAIYSPLGRGCYDIHFEKVDHSLKGAPQFLVRELALALLELGGKLMNREQDLGLEGLRRAKESLDPLYLYRRSILTPQIVR